MIIYYLLVGGTPVGWEYKGMEFPHNIYSKKGQWQSHQTVGYIAVVQENICCTMIENNKFRGVSTEQLSDQVLRTGWNTFGTPSPRVQQYDQGCTYSICFVLGDMGSMAYSPAFTGFTKEARCNEVQENVW